jgi:hypothetical protein
MNLTFSAKSSWQKYIIILFVPIFIRAMCLSASASGKKAMLLSDLFANLAGQDRMKLKLITS